MLSFPYSLLVAARFKEASNAAEEILSRLCPAQAHKFPESSSQESHFFQGSPTSGISGTSCARNSKDPFQANGFAKEGDDADDNGVEEERLQAVVAAGAVYVQAMHARKKHGKAAETLRIIFGWLSAVPPTVFLTW